MWGWDSFLVSKQCVRKLPVKRGHTHYFHWSRVWQVWQCNSQWGKRKSSDLFKFSECINLFQPSLKNNFLHMAYSILAKVWFAHMHEYLLSDTTFSVRTGYFGYLYNNTQLNQAALCQPKFLRKFSILTLLAWKCAFDLHKTRILDKVSLQQLKVYIMLKLLRCRCLSVCVCVKTAKAEETGSIPGWGGW